MTGSGCIVTDLLRPHSKAPDAYNNFSSYYTESLLDPT
jgi:hypothetical protein